MGDLDKIKVIICIFPAKDLPVFNFNQTNVGLLTTDMFPVDMHNISAGMGISGAHQLKAITPVQVENMETE